MAQHMNGLVYTITPLEGYPFRAYPGCEEYYAFGLVHHSQL